MDSREIAKLITDITTPVISEYVAEVRELKQQLEHMKRQIILLKTVERTRRHRELQAEATADAD